jgi:hypothetical protein
MDRFFDKLSSPKISLLLVGVVVRGLIGTTVKENDLASAYQVD